MTQTCFFHSEDLSNTEITVNEELAGISQWLKVNRLSLNIKKDTIHDIDKERSKCKNSSSD